MERLWTVSDLLSWVTSYFKDKQIEEPRLEAEVLLAYCLQISRLGLYTSYDRPVSQEERETLKSLLKRRLTGEPMAYLTGQKEFMSLSFMVSPAVLIPRPDTEVLVERAINIVKEKGFTRVIDVGTGSGAIALSLAHYLPDLMIQAADISEDALAVARINAGNLGLEGQVQFLHSDLLTQVAGTFELIIANLPYVPTRMRDQISVSVREYEPGLALWAGEDGLDIYRQFIPQAASKLDTGGCLLIEIDQEQQEPVKTLLDEYQQINVIHDLSGRARAIEAWKE
ncbi:MAG: peptide chain release factor N(5)-glutamine methyltransferase [Methylocystaceae bacterium]